MASLCPSGPSPKLLLEVDRSTLGRSARNCPSWALEPSWHLLDADSSSLRWWGGHTNTGMMGAVTNLLPSNSLCFWWARVQGQCRSIGWLFWGLARADLQVELKVVTAKDRVCSATASLGHDTARGHHKESCEHLWNCSWEPWLPCSSSCQPLPTRILCLLPSGPSPWAQESLSSAFTAA